MSEAPKPKDYAGHPRMEPVPADQPIDMKRYREFNGNKEDNDWLTREQKGFEHLATFVDAVVEPRLRRNIGAEDQTDEGWHRSNSPNVNLVRYGASTSWSLNPSKESKQDFAYCRNALVEALRPENDDATMMQKLRALRTEVSDRSAHALSDIAAIWEQDIPEELRDRIGPLNRRMQDVFDSGGLAQRFFGSLFCPNAPWGSTNENGSDFVAAIRKERGDELMNIRNADNTLRSEEAIIADYDRLIRRGCRYFSVTRIPKTGEDLCNVVYAVEDMIRAHNTAHPDDRILWVLDWVQYGGRDDPEALYRMLGAEETGQGQQERGLIAAILTTSKGYGDSLPHISIPILTDFGMTRVQQAIEEGEAIPPTGPVARYEQLIDDRLKEHARKAIEETEGGLPTSLRHVPNPPGWDFGELARTCGWKRWIQRHPEPDHGLLFMQDLRLIDAARQMRGLYDAGKDVMYGDVAHTAQRQYRVLFEACGMKILDDELSEYGIDRRTGKHFLRKKPSLDLVMEFPELTVDGVEAALTYCARQNTMFGGPMKTGERVIIRFGLSWKLLAQLSTGKLSQDAFQKELVDFQGIVTEAIKVGKEASENVLTKYLTY